MNTATECINLSRIRKRSEMNISQGILFLIISIHLIHFNTEITEEMCSKVLNKMFNNQCVQNVIT